MTGGHADLRTRSTSFRLVHLDFSLRFPLVRRSGEEFSPFGHEQACLHVWWRRDACDMFIVVGISLLEGVEGTLTGKHVDTRSGQSAQTAESSFPICRPCPNERKKRPCALRRYPLRRQRWDAREQLPPIGSSRPLFPAIVERPWQSLLRRVPPSGAMLGFTDGVRISSWRISKTSDRETTFFDITRALSFFLAALRSADRYLPWSCKRSKRHVLRQSRPFSSKEEVKRGPRRERRSPSHRVPSRHRAARDSR